MNKDADELEEGELLDESFEFKEITWKVSNALSLPDSVDYKVQSKNFSFAGATWRLLMYPYGQTKYKTAGYIDLNIERLYSRFPEQTVFYKYSFKTVDGKESDSFSGTIKCNRTVSSISVVGFLIKSKFIDKKDIIVKDGVLTILCEMRVKKIALINKCSQIESVTSFFGEYITDFLK